MHAGSHCRDEKKMTNGRREEVPRLYLDTNHLSDLVRHPDRDDCAEILALIERGEVRLGISFFNFYELSHPDFSSRPQVGELLDRLDLDWAVFLPDLFDREFKAGFARALGFASPVRGFYGNLNDAWNIPTDETRPPSWLLEHLAGEDEFREKVVRTATFGAQLDDRLKDRAAIVQRPLEPLRAMLEDRGIGADRSPGGLHLPVPYDSNELVERAGGLDAFPAYQVWHALFSDRLGDPNYETDPNDILDETHCCYLPYVDAMAVDRTTLGRLRNTHLEVVEQATRQLEEVPDLLGIQAPEG